MWRNYITRWIKLLLFLQTQLTKIQLVPLVKSNELRVRLYHCLLFDESKQKLDTIPPNIYGQFILNVYGVWCYDNIGYVQCYAIQAKLYQPMYLTTYGFLDETKSKIPIPPPLPTSLKKQYQRKLKPKPKPKSMNGFQPRLSMKFNRCYKNFGLNDDNRIVSKFRTREEGCYFVESVYLLIPNFLF